MNESSTNEKTVTETVTNESAAPSGGYQRSRRGEGQSHEGGAEGGRGREGRYGAQGGADERARAGAMEVVVSHNIEKAMKILKRKLIKEGLFKELKSRRYFEKPSERRKRKEKEARKKVRKDEARIRKSPGVL
jgi:small subunit ribosomal protein S21